MKFGLAFKVIASITGVGLVPASFGIVSSTSSSKGAGASLPTVKAEILKVDQPEGKVNTEAPKDKKLTAEEEKQIIEEYHTYKRFYKDFGQFVSFIKSFRTVSSPLIKLANVAGVNIGGTWIESFLKAYQQEKSQNQASPTLHSAAVK